MIKEVKIDKNYRLVYEGDRYTDDVDTVTNEVITMRDRGQISPAEATFLLQLVLTLYLRDQIVSEWSANNSALSEKRRSGISTLLLDLSSRPLQKYAA
jgi:hypothetical protein